jgi:hypothetical protein
MIFHDTGFLEELFKPLGLQPHAKKFGDVLEGAFFVGRAVSAIHIMNREEQAKRASLQVSYGRGVRFDNQRSGDSDGARRNRFSIDFNETQSARGIRVLHAFQIAEVRDIDAVTQAGLKEDRPFLNLQLFIVNNQLDHALQHHQSPRHVIGRDYIMTNDQIQRPNQCQSLPARLRAGEPAFGGARGDQGSKSKLKTHMPYTRLKRHSECEPLSFGLDLTFGL